MVQRQGPPPKLPTTILVPEPPTTILGYSNKIENEDVNVDDDEIKTSDTSM